MKSAYHCGLGDIVVIISINANRLNSPVSACLSTLPRFTITDNCSLSELDKELPAAHGHLDFFISR